MWEYKRASFVTVPDEEDIAFYGEGGWEFFELVYDTSKYVWYAYFKRRKSGDIPA